MRYVARGDATVFFMNVIMIILFLGINKPNKQTILPQESVEEFFRTFPLKKVRHLGGKLGLILREELNCITMGDVANLSENVLKHRFDAKTGYVILRAL